jgi:iron-sulfur cluster assembly protein
MLSPQQLKITGANMNIEPVLVFKSNAYAPKGITLTDSAAMYIDDQLTDRSEFAEDKGIGIRFGVTGVGCGGYSYTVGFVDVDNGEDHIFEQDEIKIFVDQKSILMIDGMEVNYANEGFKSGLEFNNPLAVQTCGCGHPLPDIVSRLGCSPRS